MLTQYASTPENDRNPFTLETLTTEPRAAVRCGAAARISRNGARRLTSSIASHCSSVVVSIVPEPMMPAALTNAVIPPKDSTAT